MPVLSNFIKYFPKRTLIAAIALVLYAIPGLIQDVHRLEHMPGKADFIKSSFDQFNLPSEKCPICKYEFCPVNEPLSNSVLPSIPASGSVFIASTGNQIPDPVFSHLRLRAPPVF